jgi:hypothetical protein
LDKKCRAILMARLTHLIILAECSNDLGGLDDVNLEDLTV